MYLYDTNIVSELTKKQPNPNVIAFIERCAQIWGKLLAENPHNPIDKQLAATALAHDLCLVTRNVKDIEITGVKFINPFDEPPHINP